MSVTERLNEPTVYDFEGGVRLRHEAMALGAKRTYSTKKIEFFEFRNGRKFLLEPDRNGQVNLGFPPGLAGKLVMDMAPMTGRNSNVKAHWRLPNNEFLKIIVMEPEVEESKALSVRSAVDLLSLLSQ